MISSKAQEYRDELVKKLCDAMENETAPWQRTWTDGDAPFNAVSGRAYHGINAVNLALQSQALGHSEDGRWLTFDQAKEKGWHVKQGEKGTHV
ncbi:MAG: ArdC family protein, partial [Synergistaceae bacterium]|nr:ArdC family protein [Synergistaceae bacterium]